MSAAGHREDRVLNWELAAHRGRGALRLGALFLETILAGLFLIASLQAIRSGHWILTPIPISAVLFLGFLAARNLQRHLRTPAVFLEDEALADHALLHPLRIPFHAITEIREFSDCLEVLYTVAESPGLWRLTPDLLSPTDRAALAAELKRRVRSANPNVRIFDEHTGPPPAPQ